MINSCPRDNMQRLCELFPNNYNSQGGWGSTKLLLATLLPLDWSVIRYFRPSTVHPEYCIVLEQLHVPCNAADKNPVGNCAATVL